MIRYPILVFYSGNKLAVFDQVGQFQSEMCCMDCIPKVLDVAFDSNGRLLTEIDGDDSNDSAAERDPDRLRQMLLHVLQLRGQAWASDAPLESLVAAAQRAYGFRAWTLDAVIRKAVTDLLHFLHLKSPAS